MAQAKKNCVPCYILAFAFVFFFASAESLHIVNLTALANCDDEGLEPLGYFTEVRQEVNPDNGLCEAMHAKYNWTKLATGTKLMSITVYKCPKDSTGPCLDNPTYHEETLDCTRLVEDSSGPWHMYTSSMTGSKCGEQVGSFEMEYTTLKINHLVKYLDIDDEKYRRFRIKTHMVLAETKELNGCVYVDFDLLKVIT